MPSPFPGFDPYLESPGIWPGFQMSLTCHIVGTLNEVLPQGYVACTGIRRLRLPWQQDVSPSLVMVERPRPKPDTDTTPQSLAISPGVRVFWDREEFHIGYVTIQRLADKQTLTIVEIPTLIDKTTKSGLAAYRRRQAKRLRRPVNLVEID